MDVYSWEGEGRGWQNKDFLKELLLRLKIDPFFLHDFGGRLLFPSKKSNEKKTLST